MTVFPSVVNATERNVDDSYTSLNDQPSNEYIIPWGNFK